MSKTGRGYSLIKSELDLKRCQLKDRNADLAKARRHVLELEQTCAGLQVDIADLEHDENALTRGYLSIMADNSVRP